MAEEQAGAGVNEACRAVLAAVELVAPFRAGSVNTVDADTMMPSGGLVVGLERADCQPFWNNELRELDDRAAAPSAADLLAGDPIATISGVAAGVLEVSQEFRDFYAARGIGDEMRIAFLAGGVCLGVAIFVRAVEAGPFSRTEVEDVRALLPEVVRLLRRALGRDAQRQRPHPPMVVVVDADDVPRLVSQGGGEVLDDLRQDISCGCDDRALPETLRGAVVLARVRGGLSCRVLGRTGHWRRIEATPVQDGGGAVAVIVSSVPAVELARIVLDSYGFTARERQVVEGLARGLELKVIAAELEISTFTVQDHVKAIYRKAGVGSRGELVADVLSPLLPGTAFSDLF